MIRALLEKNRQNARTYGQCKQRDRNFKKKNQEEMLVFKNIIAEIKTAFDRLISDWT